MEMQMQMRDIISSCRHEKWPEEADSTDFSSFKKSLQELRDLRPQLHFAADYCERTFLKVNEKKFLRRRSIQASNGKHIFEGAEEHSLTCQDCPLNLWCRREDPMLWYARATFALHNASFQGKTVVESPGEALSTLFLDILRAEPNLLKLRINVIDRVITSTLWLDIVVLYVQSWISWVMEDTKEYICRAVVTVVDHLGSVSTNLECRLSNNRVISEAELRIDCLKQRLLACEQYAHKVNLTKICCIPDFPRHCTRYIAPPLPNLEKSNGELRTMYKHGIEDDLPLFLYTCAHESPSTTVSSVGFEFSALLPVRNVPHVLLKPQTPFHFQGTQKLGHKERTRKSVRSNDFLLLLRRSK